MAPTSLSPTEDPEAPGQSVFWEDSEGRNEGGWGRGLLSRTEKPLAQQDAALKEKGDPEQVPSRNTGWSMDLRGSEQVPFLLILAPCIQQQA